MVNYHQRVPSAVVVCVRNVPMNSERSSVFPQRGGNTRMFWPRSEPTQGNECSGSTAPASQGRRRDGFQLPGCSGKALFPLSCCVVFFHNRNRLMVQGAGTMNAHLAFGWGQRCRSLGRQLMSPFPLCPCLTDMQSFAHRYVVFIDAGRWLFLDPFPSTLLPFPSLSFPPSTLFSSLSPFHPWVGSPETKSVLYQTHLVVPNVIM